MEEYNFDLGSTIYDKQFETIEGLSWLPWVGHNYINSKRRILIIAESHYVNGEDIELKKKTLINDRLNTRMVVAECPIGKEWSNPMFENLHRCLFGINNPTSVNTEEVWNNLVFYNFIQTPMNYNGNEIEKERPKEIDFYDGWRVFIEILKIIKPTDCLFVGVTASNYFNQYMNEHGIEHTNVNFINIGSNTYGREFTISFEENKSIPIIGIQHTSKYFSWILWHDFLNENASQITKHLNRLIAKELLIPEKEVRYSIMKELYKKDFNHYYVIGEKDIKFAEDDTFGWIQIWVTLGRLRNDKQIDCVTIGCYGDNILLVETGIRKNPDTNLAETENNEWWTKCASKNFVLNNTTKNDIINWLINNDTYLEVFS